MHKHLKQLYLYLLIFIGTSEKNIQQPVSDSENLIQPQNDESFAAQPVRENNSKTKILTYSQVTMNLQNSFGALYKVCKTQLEG